VSRFLLSLCINLTCQVAKCFGVLSKGTPLFYCTGLLPSKGCAANTVCSFASIHEELSSKTKSFCGKFQQYVLDYSVEWEKVVRNRIDGGLKQAEDLLRELDHYHMKVSSLRSSTNQVMNKGRMVQIAKQEKLSRNEEKFLEAKQRYDQVTANLILVMEEVTQRSWRDLHPMLLKCAQFDMTISSEEAEAFSALRSVVDSLKVVANDNGISPHHRLKDLASLKAELLSTRSGRASFLKIDYDGGTNSTPQTSFGSLQSQNLNGFHR
jgi:hypothetical protein